jgi:hypothetical protein
MLVLQRMVEDWNYRLVTGVGTYMNKCTRPFTQPAIHADKFQHDLKSKEREVSPKTAAIFWGDVANYVLHMERASVNWDKRSVSQ